MPVKPNRKKKLAAPPTRATAKTPAAKAAAANRGGKNHQAPAPTACYVAVAPLQVTITRDKPKAGKSLGPCVDFEGTKSVAIEALIAAIEDAERRLAACKRATTIDQLSGT